MKKLVVILVVVAFFAGLVSSCGSSHTCPAYSKLDTQKTETRS